MFYGSLLKNDILFEAIYQVQLKNLNLAEIALKMHYSNAVQLSRQLKRIKGLTPHISGNSGKPGTIIRKLVEQSTKKLNEVVEISG